VKNKYALKDFEPLWNCQTIEVRGRIYLTGGAKSNTRVYLKHTLVLSELLMKFEPLANMHFERDAHGISSWQDEYIIVVGSWHVEESRKKCEIYSISNNEWQMLPDLNNDTCAPGIVLIQNRFIYKIGGNVNIRKIEYLDLHQPDYWVNMNVTNQIGKKQSLNRCLLFPMENQY